MGTSTRDTTQTLASQAWERTKMYTIVDANSRPTQVYTAPEGAREGTKCTLVEYEYLSPTSGVVVRMRETQSDWQSAFDIGQPYPAP